MARSATMPTKWVWRKLQIPEAMRAWGEPGNMTMREYIPQTQAYVARLFQIALERMRERKHEGAGGVLHFYAIDIWPSVAMAAIDVDRRPTKVYDTVRRSFAPVAALFQYDRDKWKTGELFLLRAVGHQRHLGRAAGSATLQWRIVSVAGKAVRSGKFSTSMTPDSASRTGSVDMDCRRTRRIRIARFDCGRPG